MNRTHYRVDPRDFERPIVYRDRKGREYAKKPGAQRKVPREVRAHLYQLDLTVRETRAEIARILREYGHGDSRSNHRNVMARIRRERG